MLAFQDKHRDKVIAFQHLFLSYVSAVKRIEENGDPTGEFHPTKATRPKLVMEKTEDGYPRLPARPEMKAAGSDDPDEPAPEEATLYLQRLLRSYLTAQYSKRLSLLTFIG